MYGVEPSNIIMMSVVFVPVAAVIVLLGTVADSEVQVKCWRVGMTVCIVVFLVSTAVLIVGSGILRYWPWVTLMETAGVSLTGAMTAIGVLARVREEDRTGQRQMVGFLSVILITFWILFTFFIIFSGGDEKEVVWNGQRVVKVYEGWGYTYHEYTDVWTLGKEIGRSPDS